MRMLSWIRHHWEWSGVALFIVAVPFVVIAVRYLTSPLPEQRQRLDPEGQWSRAIAQYGIEPVFPPEEDFAVGDLFVQIVRDEDPDPSARGKVEESTAFRATAVKLDHIDVRPELDEIYAKLPFFGELASETGSGQTDPGLFRHQRKALPIAAFPGVTVSGTQQAAGRLSGMGLGLFGFAASNENLERLELPAIETYGLPSVAAQTALNQYCSATYTKTICSEETARRYLRPLVGDRILAQYLDPRDLKPHYPIKIRLFMVSRVYLARAIINQVRFGRAESGNLQLSAGERSVEPPRPPPTLGTGGDAVGSVTELQKRIDDLEKRISGSPQAAAGSFGSSFSRQLGLDQSFARPVTIGYRSVSYYEPEPINP
jgi:hypothetical protein